MLNTVLKAGQVLDLFDKQNPEWGVSEVATELDIPKSSAHSLLASLAQIGLLRHGEGGRYRLGWKMLNFGQIVIDTTEFRVESRAVMEQLAAQYRETIHLAVLDDGVVVYADKLQGQQAVQVAVTGLGVRLSPHCSAVGKVLLSHQPWPWVRDIMEKQGMPKFTDNTITDVDRFQEELLQVREQGFAYDLEEAVPDLCCVAAPIYDYDSEVVAALSMSIPAYRFERAKKEYRAAVIRACQKISRNLGYMEFISSYRKKVATG